MLRLPTKQIHFSVALQSHRGFLICNRLSVSVDVVSEKKVSDDLATVLWFVYHVNENVSPSYHAPWPKAPSVEYWTNNHEYTWVNTRFIETLVHYPMFI
jgi:hypothetical protein